MDQDVKPVGPLPKILWEQNLLQHQLLFHNHLEICKLLQEELKILFFL